MRGNSLIFFWCLEIIWLVLYFLGWRITPLSNDTEYDVWVWKEKFTNTGGMMALTCARDVLFDFFSHWQSLQLGWHILENGSNWQAVLRTVHWRKHERLGGWHIFENGVLDKLYCVRSANGTSVVRWVFLCFVLGVRYIFVARYGGREA